MNITTVRAIVIVMVATVAAIVALAIFVPGDNTVVILQIVGVVAPTTAALLALLKSTENSVEIEKNTAKTDETQGKLQQLEIHVDGRLSQLLEQKGLASHAAGVHQGEQNERNRAESSAGPTTIEAAGPTTIVVDPSSNVEIVRDSGG